MDERFKSYLGGQLRSLRKQAGLTQEELAAQVERTGEAISNIELGKSVPTIETLLAISSSLEIPIRDFFPPSAFDDGVSQNRMKLEAEVVSALRGLSDKQLRIALAQIKALTEID